MQSIAHILNVNQQANNATQQAINQLTLQLSQMASQIGERLKGTFPSQPVANPKDARSTPSNPTQINAIHTLRSEKKADNQVNQTISSLPNPVSSSSGSDKSEGRELSKSLNPRMSHQLHFQTGSDRSILLK